MFDRRYDKDNSGDDIDMTELRGALDELGLSESDSASAEALLNKYDANHSGRLEISEFRLLVKELQQVAAEKKMFESDIALLKARIRASGRGLINPRGTFVQYWDIITAVALCFTLFVAPFEVGLNLNLPTRFRTRSSWRTCS